jgi:hypothetical protein
MSVRYYTTDLELCWFLYVVFREIFGFGFDELVIDGRFFLVRFE